MYYYNPFWGMLSGVLTAVFWALIVILIIRAIRGSRGRRRWHRYYHFEDDALETLRERYAKGEISKEEYEERKSVLVKD